MRRWHDPQDCRAQARALITLQTLLAKDGLPPLAAESVGAFVSALSFAASFLDHHAEDLEFAAAANEVLSQARAAGARSR